MLDIKAIRKDPKVFKNGLGKRGFDEGVIDDIIALDKQRREMVAGRDELRRQKKLETKKYFERV